MKVLSIQSPVMKMLGDSPHFIISEVSSLPDGIDFAKSYSYDLILVGLPSRQGGYTALFRELRGKNAGIPIMVLSGSGGDVLHVQVLNDGADDYIALPVLPEVLAARMRAVVRRVAGYTHNVITYGELKLDTSSMVLHVNGKSVHLAKREYLILELFMMRPGTLVSREQILELTNDEENNKDIRSVDTEVKRVRKKIESLGVPRYIETLYGVGYKLAVPKAFALPA